MLDLYMDLPAWLRTGIALLVLALGGWMVFAGFQGRPHYAEQKDPRTGEMQTIVTPPTPGASSLFRLGLVVTGFGAVLVIVSGKSDAEKSGYNF